MSAPTPAAPASHGTPLSERIYVELVARAIVPGPDGTQAKINPEHLAKLSLTFAEAYMKTLNAQRAAAAAADPAGKQYKVSADDIGAWIK